MSPKSSVPLVEAVEKVTGYRPHVQTCRRWVKRGVQGIRLDAKYIGGRYYTTLEAVQAFIDATTESRIESARAAKIEFPKPPVPGRVVAAVKEFDKLCKGGGKL
ncbi:MAG: hypothetical protein RL240_1648 [Planctomycetota bacterium]|jgi:hypothetical protein